MKETWVDASLSLIDEGIWVTDSSDGILYMNEATIKLSGCSNCHAHSKVPHDFISIKNGTGQLLDFNLLKQEATERKLVRYKYFTLIPKKETLHL